MNTPVACMKEVTNIRLVGNYWKSPVTGQLANTVYLSLNGGADITFPMDSSNTDFIHLKRLEMSAATTLLFIKGLIPDQDSIVNLESYCQEHAIEFVHFSHAVPRKIDLTPRVSH